MTHSTTFRRIIDAIPEQDRRRYREAREAEERAGVITCPQCDGEGRVDMCVQCHRDLHEFCLCGPYAVPVEMVCWRCAGSGEMKLSEEDEDE